MSDLHGTSDPVAVLRAHGFRATPARTALLDHLSEIGRPQSIETIRANWSEAPNQATLYRTLNDLAAAGIVRRVDLNTGVAHFEYTPHHPHHHHLVCTDCGLIEDIDLCPLPQLTKAVLSTHPRFQEITDHQLEVFGRCQHCAQSHT